MALQVPLALDVVQGAQRSVICVQGEITISNCQILKQKGLQLIDEAEREDGKRSFIINLDGVRYLDSAGQGVLIGLDKKIKEHPRHADWRLYLIINNSQIRKIFNITGLINAFTIYKSMDDVEEDEQIRGM